MTNELKDLARAKLNLTLDVKGLEADGFHGVVTIMQTVAFGDDVELVPGDGPLVVQSNLPYLPTGEKNLAVRAARHFFEVTGTAPVGGVINIKKRIPVCGGLGGGSADAAAVLRILNRFTGVRLSTGELEKLSEPLGSDVPFCIAGGTVLGRGRGQLLTPLSPLPDCGAVICRPDFCVSTPELFRAIDAARVRARPDTAGALAAIGAGDLKGVARRLFNVFEAVLPRQRRQIVLDIKDRLYDLGAVGAAMSGTGSAVFGLFPSSAQASSAAKGVRSSGILSWAAETSPRMF